MLRERGSCYTRLLCGLWTGLLFSSPSGSTLADSPVAVQAQAAQSATDHQASPRDRYGDQLPAGAAIRYGTTRLRFNQLGYNVSFSIDSRQIYSSDRSSFVHIWNLDGSRADVLDLGEQVDRAVLLPDCTHLLVNRFTGVTLRELPSGRVVAEIPSEQNNYRDMKLAPNGFWLASMPNESVLQMWDTQSGDELLTLKPLDARRQGYEAFAFSPNSQRMALTLRSGAIQIWDLHQGRVIHDLTTQARKVRWQSFYFLDDDRLIGCGSTDRRDEDGIYQTISHLEQWDLDQAEASRLLKMEDRELRGAPNASLSLDRSLLATSHHNEIVLWDTRTGDVLRSLVAEKEVGRQIAIAPNNELIASSGRNSKMLVWDLRTGEELHPQPDTHHGSVLAVAESPDGKVLVSVGEAGTTLAWDRGTGDPLRVLHRNVGWNLNVGWTRDVQFFPDSDRVLLCSEYYDPTSGEPSFKGRVAIVGLEDGQLLREWPLLDRGMQVAINDSGSLIAFATGLGDAFFGMRDAPSPEVQVWDVAENKLIAKLADAPGNLTGLVFRDDQQLYMHNESGAYVWEISSSTAKTLYPKEGTTPTQAPRKVILAQDGESVWASFYQHSRQDRTTNGSLSMIKLADGEVLWEKYSVGQVVSCMAESPDGNVLAVGLRPSNQLLILNASTGEELKSFQLNETHLRSLQFSDDSARLYAGMGSGDIVRWDVQ